MSFLFQLALILSFTTSMMGQGARDRNLSHKRLRMDVTTASVPESVPSSSDYRTQNLALEKAERATLRSQELGSRKSSVANHPTEKVVPARDLETLGQIPRASSSLKLRGSATNARSRGRRKGWVNGSGR